ncbi:6696_t:CDS:2, partial [Funneliformis mosseae]
EIEQVVDLISRQPRVVNIRSWLHQLLRQPNSNIFMTVDSELERDMRYMCERFGLMITMYGLKKKIDYKLEDPELETNFTITEFIPRNAEKEEAFNEFIKEYGQREEDWTIYDDDWHDWNDLFCEIKTH